MSAGPRARDGGCGYVEVECVYRCGRFFQRRLLREHKEEICPNRPVEVQMSSNLCKIKEVTEENEQLKMDRDYGAKRKAEYCRRREQQFEGSSSQT